MVEKLKILKTTLLINGFASVVEKFTNWLKQIEFQRLRPFDVNFVQAIEGFSKE
jgi:hypothetical protein